MQLPGRDHDVDCVVKGHQAEAIAGVKARDEPVEREKRRLQPLAGHRAAAVEHDLHGARCALVARRCERRGDFEHQGDLIVLLDGDEIEIEVCVYAHLVAPSGR